MRPELRGRGLAAAGMAAVVTEALRNVAPVVSLYVNDFNAPARAAYRRVGFTETAHVRLRPVLSRLDPAAHRMNPCPTWPRR